MPASRGEGDGLDLSGVWDGLFSYPSRRPPVMFVATLSESGAWLNGVIEEVATSGPSKGQKLSATVQGRRAGRSVSLLKTYDRVFGGYDSVHYEGEINADATEIEGRWAIVDRLAGTFLMIRSDGGRDAAERRAFERLEAK
jgi:hypothetical protein